MHNIGYKILSVVLAVMTWVVIINIADPVTTKSFRGIEVEVRNQNAITSINQIYEVVEGHTVDFTVKGKASIVKNLKESDFVAYADLSQLSPVYAADINVTCTKTDSLEIDIHNKMMIVKLENIKSKNMQVSVETVGKAAEGYYVGDFEVKPNMITVSGAASRISKVASIKIDVNVDGAKKSFSTKLKPVAYDDDDNVIDSKYLTFTNNNVSIDEIEVSVSIYNTKIIPVILEISGQPDSGYIYNNEYEYTPQTISIGGPSKRLAKINSITVPVDISDAKEQYETNISMEQYLPDNIKIVGDEEEVSVRVLFEKIITKDITLSINDIEMRGVRDDLTVDFNNYEATVSFTLKGTKDQISNYNKENIGAYIDLEGKDKGMYFLQPECANVSAELFEKMPGTIQIELKEKVTDNQENETVATPEPESESEPEATAIQDNPDDEGGNDE